MATRNPRVAAAPQPANQGAAVLAGKQKAAAATRTGARNPLGDIGNLVVPEGINRPITRSFGAQLLKNAQAKATLANKNAVAPAYPAAPRAAQKLPRKAPAKPAPRPEQAAKITTAPDQNKKPSESAAGSTSGNSARNSRKKAVNTLTTVLTARSKFACGLTEKPKEVVEDIDKLDGDNQLAVVDYIEDIYKFYKDAENESRPTDYMGSQPEINAKMRAVLTDWIIEVHYKFELMPETLYLIMYLVDRYLSLQPVPRVELQLVGVAAMLIAGKYEEIWAPEVRDLIQIADNAYSRKQILGMEKAILNKMEWNLTVPTMYVFLARFAKAAGSDDKEMEHMVFYFAELALMEYSMVTLRPSFVAASAVYAARCTLKRSPLWTDTLKYHTGFGEPQLKECAKILIDRRAAVPGGKFKAIYKKYAKEQFACVSLIPRQRDRLAPSQPEASSCSLRSPNALPLFPLLLARCVARTRREEAHSSWYRHGRRRRVHGQGEALRGHDLPAVRLRRHERAHQGLAEPGHEPLRARRVPPRLRRALHGPVRARRREEGEAQDDVVHLLADLRPCSARAGDRPELLLCRAQVHRPDFRLRHEQHPTRHDLRDGSDLQDGEAGREEGEVPGQDRWDAGDCGGRDADDAVQGPAHGAGVDQALASRPRRRRRGPRRRGRRHQRPGLVPRLDVRHHRHPRLGVPLHPPDAHHQAVLGAAVAHHAHLLRRHAAGRRGHLRHGAPPLRLDHRLRHEPPRRRLRRHRDVGHRVLRAGLGDPEDRAGVRVGVQPAHDDHRRRHGLLHPLREDLPRWRPRRRADRGRPILRSLGKAQGDAGEERGRQDGAADGGVQGRWSQWWGGRRRTGRRGCRWT